MVTENPSEEAVTAVIVTYNSSSDIEHALDALMWDRQQVPIEVVVVDNGSTDDTVRRIRARGGCVVVEQANRGYAAGINAGVAASRATGPILVLNPDTECAPGAVATLQRVCATRNAIVAPRLVDAEGVTSPSIRRKPTLRRALGLSSTGHPSLTERVEVGPSYDTAHVVDWATGAALMVPRVCHEVLGGWDESYFMYSEETDFCIRASRHGWPTWYEPSATVRHRGEGSGFSSDLYAIQAINRVRFYRRQRGAMRGVAYFSITVARESVRAVLGDALSRRAVSALVSPSHRPSVLGAEPHLVPR